MEYQDDDDSALSELADFQDFSGEDALNLGESEGEVTRHDRFLMLLARQLRG